MKKAVMYGAGNIGRGFIGQLFSQSGYEVTFLDINEQIIDRLNKDHCYPIRIVSDEESKEIIVENVRGVNAMNLEAVAAEIAEAQIMATAIGVNVLPRIVKPIVMGLRKRWEKENFSPLNIIICENLLDANHYLAKLIKQELTVEEQKWFDEKIGLVEASVGRMVPAMTPEMQEGNPLRIFVEEYCELPVDKEGFKGDIPGIIHMVPFAPFDFYIQRKLFMHNLGHAIMAYLGYLSGYKYIWEACKNPEIKKCVLKALQESAIAMSKKHGVKMEILLDHAENLLHRFENQSLGDTIERVGKDPVRKLAYNDRLVGAARLCIKQEIVPFYICLGIAAGLLFDASEDIYAQRIQSSMREKGIKETLSEFCSIQESDYLFSPVVECYSMLKKGLNEKRMLDFISKFKG